MNYLSLDGMKLKKKKAESLMLKNYYFLFNKETSGYHFKIQINESIHMEKKKWKLFFFSNQFKIEYLL